MLVLATSRSGALASVFTHPALSCLLANATVEQGALPGALGVHVPAPGRVQLDHSVAERAGALPLIRYGLEAAWMRGVPGLPEAAGKLLAARAAGCCLDLLPARERAAAVEDPASAVFARLSGPVPPLAQLTACWRVLSEGAPDDAAEAPDLTALQLVARLWQLATPTEALLVQGGDDRLSLDPATAQNRYLCMPWPQPDVISFSSCTASSITPAALAAAEQARQDLFTAAVTALEDAVLASASDQITAELLVYFDAEDIAEAVLAASGTDATLLLTGMLAAERPRQTITTVLMSPSETGSGVPEAVQGRHFAPCTASGQTVEKGGAVDGFPPGLAMVSVALRTADGLPRRSQDIAADCEASIEAAAASGHVVLHAIDGSKTGLAAPSLLALDLLADRFGAKLDIVIDACQLRIEPEVIRQYLHRGWPVLVTGSKFFGAPGFCGAILFPKARFRRIAGAGRLPDGLGAYASVSNGSVSRRCPGLLLRWAAALMQMQDFARMPVADIRHAIDSAGARARAEIMRHAGLHLVQSPRPCTGAWSHRPSVLTFALHSAGRLLSAAELRPLYLAMADDAADRLPDRAGQAAHALAAQPCRIGQPVQLGPAIGGLRVAFSAAQIVTRDDLAPALAKVFAKLTTLLKQGAAPAA